jgi:hypothetical protein
MGVVHQRGTVVWPAPSSTPCQYRRRVSDEVSMVVVMSSSSED